MEGNQYFPPEALDKQYFKESSHTSVCGWKGTAKYYTIEVNGKVRLSLPAYSPDEPRGVTKANNASVAMQTNENAAWYYDNPKPAAEHIKDKVLSLCNYGNSILATLFEFKTSQDKR